MINTKTSAAAFIATALLTLSSTAFALDGAQLYKTKTCLTCHGKDGSGNTKMGKKSGARDYRDAKVQASFSDAEGIKAIKEGVKDKKGKEKMKAYGKTYSDAEIKALLTYIRGVKQ